jgi:hypothetical protein
MQALALATYLARHVTTGLAQSAMPNAPVRPDPASRRKRLRLRRR